jgi:ribosomal protein S18 acetylase RimI-like enzyme
MGITFRQLVAGDRHAVREMLVRCAAFSEEEVRVALEMVDAGIQGDYSLPAAEIDGEVRAYACIGKAPLTASTWYEYWICVHPATQRAGVGRALQSYLEDLVRKSRGERIVLETSGRPDYGRTRHFYRQAGFTEMGRIPNFFKQGDDCVVLCKILD